MKTIVIASNKGGTGKTTMSCALAKSFAEIAPTAILDADVTGPDVMGVLGVPYEHATFNLDNFYPITVTDSLQVFSPAMLIPDEVGVAWTGELRGEMIRELLERVMWDDPEYMIIDSPPSTSDELLTVLLRTDPAGVVIVTLGSDSSISDAKRLVSLLRNEKFNIPIIGYIRNMTDIFGTGDLDGIELLGDVKKSDSLDVAHIRDRIIERMEEIA